MSHNWKAFSFRYGLAVGCIVIATVIRLLLAPSLGVQAPFITYFPAVFVTALFAGLGPALSTVVVSVLVAVLFIIPPRGYFLPQTLASWMGLGLFTFFGVGVAFLSEGLRRKAEQILQEWERFSVTLASVGDGVIVTDQNGRVTFLNPVAEELTGWSRAEAAGKPLDLIFPLISEQTRQKTENPVSQALREGQVVGLANHTILIAKDGTERAIDDSAAPIRERNGDIVGVVLVFRDVSQRRAADILRGRLAALIESSDDAIMGQTFEGIVTDWNMGAERLFGYSAEEVVGKSVYSTIVPPDRKEESLQVLRQIQQGEAGCQLETVRRTKDGRTIPVSIRISPILDAEGQVIGASAIDRDISQQREAERRRNARLAVTQSLAQAQTVEQAIDEILSAVCLSLAWHVGCFWRVQPDKNVLHCQQFWNGASNAVAEFREATMQLEFEPGQGVPGQVWETREPLWVSDVIGEPRFLRASQTEKLGLHGGFACPVMIHNEFLGVIEFFSQEIQEPDEDLLEMMTTIAGQIGQFIERKNSETALKESERLYRAIGESLDYGVWVSDPQGRNIYTSDSFLQLVGLTQEECSKYGWTTALHPEDVEETVAAWKECIQTSSTWYREHRFLGVDGQYHPVLARGVPVKDDEGNVLCWAGINLDIHQLKEAENALRDADRRKDEFLAMLSHELRNPLAPIRSGLDILAMEAGEHSEIIQLMQEQLEHVVRLVDDLLDVSRIMRGRIELKKESMELSTLIKRSVEAVRPVMEGHQQDLVVSLPEQPLWLRVDPVRVAQVFENLLNNASKYTDTGGRIELKAEGEDGQAVIRVQDTGVGIEPELLPHVFDLFTQSSRSLDRAQGGLGIGLTLVKNLVGMHGGSVSAQSPGPGKGSQFVVRLPLATQVSHAEEEEPLTSTFEPRRVVVVDDNVGAAWMLSKLVTMLGEHEVALAHDGHSALETIKDIRPDIVFLDIGLPGLDGYQVARELRKDPKFNSVFLVALTGYGQEEDRQKSKEAGLDEHLVKPPSIDQVRRVFAHPKLITASPKAEPARALQNAQRASAASQPPQKTNHQPQLDHSANFPELDLPMLKHDLGNIAYVLRLVVQILSDSNPDPEVVQNATEGLNHEVRSLEQLIESLQHMIDNGKA